jgi:hypothetical protein
VSSHVAPGIIAFAKDWHEDPTSNHHVLRELARTRRVLWLNSVGTRTPKLSSGRDLGKIRRKLGEFTKGPVNVENDLWVFSPLVLPFPHSPLARAANGRILRATIAALRWRLGLREFDLWTFLPNVADYVGSLGERRSVYYCVDEWSLFSYLNEAETRRAEHALPRRSTPASPSTTRSPRASARCAPRRTCRRTASTTTSSRARSIQRCRSPPTWRPCRAPSSASTGPSRTGSTWS